MVTCDLCDGSGVFDSFNIDTNQHEDHDCYQCGGIGFDHVNSEQEMEILNAI